MTDQPTPKPDYEAALKAVMQSRVLYDLDIEFTSAVPAAIICALEAQIARAALSPPVAGDRAEALKALNYTMASGLGEAAKRAGCRFLNTHQNTIRAALAGMPDGVPTYATGTMIDAGRTSLAATQKNSFAVQATLCWEAMHGAAAPHPAQPEAAPFQTRVNDWMQACFGAEISADKQERNHRFIEEALELVQANGCTASEAHQLVDYVYGRPVGDLTQEVGGVMVTLAALCLASGVEMNGCGETELARIWTKVEKIRAKQAAKPRHSPLPEAAPVPAVEVIDGLEEAVNYWTAIPNPSKTKQGGDLWEKVLAAGRAYLHLHKFANSCPKNPSRIPSPCLHDASKNGRCAWCGKTASQQSGAGGTVDKQTCKKSLQVQIDFLEGAARYFEKRDTKGEDRAHWSNVYNAKNCQDIAETLRGLLHPAPPLTGELMEQVREALEVAAGYIALVADGNTNIPIRKERAEVDCGLIGKALAILSSVTAKAASDAAEGA